MEKVYDFLDNSVVDIEKWLWIFAKIAIIYLISAIAVKIAKRFFKLSEKRRHYSDKTNFVFLRNFVVYVIYFSGFVAMINVIPGLQKLGTTLLAGAGILAAVIGFASQEALSNIVSGLFMVLFKPFRVGDSINVGNGTYVGTVEDISLRHTTIRNSENRMVIIPNNKLNSETIINSSILSSDTCALIEIGIGYDSNIDKVIDLVTNEALMHPFTKDNRTAIQKSEEVPQITVRVISWGDSALNLRAYVWAENSGNAFVLKCDLLKSIKERFDKEGIEIPYPYRNVIVKKESND